MKTLEKNNLDLKRITPSCGQKYSPNLYRWLTDPKAQSRSWSSRVYRDKDGTLWVGILDGRELIGSKLIGVLCSGVREGSAAWQGIDAEEIHGFWERYMTDGRCAIDTAHNMYFINDEGRWKVDGDARSCQWCGKHNQTLKRWTEAGQCEKWVTT